MENKNCATLVSIDLSVAFDMVDHSICIEVMNITLELLEQH